MAKRDEIEKKLVSLFIKKIAPYGFVPVTAYLKKKVHFFKFQMNRSGVTYTYRIDFHGQYGIWYSPYLNIQYDSMLELLNKIDPVYAKDSGLAFSVKIFDYLHQPNKQGLFKENNLHNEYLKEPYDDSSLAADVDLLFNKYFLVCVNDIVPRTDSLAKASELISSLPGITDNKKPMPWSILSAYAITQCITSIIVARLTNSKDFDQLRKRYLDYIADDEPGKNSFVDMLRKTINYLDNH